MAVNVNRMTNANIYVNGANLLGMAEEVIVPRPKAKMVDHKGLGMVGVGEFPSGLDKIEATINEKLKSDPFAQKAMADQVANVATALTANESRVLVPVQPQ